MALSLDLTQVPPGDYWLQLRVRPAVTDAEDVQAAGIAVLERMISLASQPRGVSSARRLPSWPRTKFSTGLSQLSSLKFSPACCGVLDDDALKLTYPPSDCCG